GYRISACRPEHFERRDGYLHAPQAASGDLYRVNIVLRNWLHFEQFSNGPLSKRMLLPQFVPLLDASAAREVLLLNPIAERLLFSKAILAELWNDRYGLFHLSAEERRFVSRYIAPTAFLSPEELGKLDLKSVVLKPSSEFAGKSVFVGGESASGKPPSQNFIREGVWVRQEKQVGERPRGLLYQRQAGRAPRLRRLYVVHGLLV